MSIDGTAVNTLARVTNVTRRFGEVTALDDVSLEIRSGQIVGLLGPNGAGKSTLLTLLQGLRRPTSGTVELFGGSPQVAANRRLLGCTPQATALPETLRVGEVIDFVGVHFADAVPTPELAEEFGLGDLLRRQTGSLSGGQKRRLSVALAFVGRPRLVLLDEPTTGLDVDARHTLWEAIRRQHDAGATVVITSHYLEEIEALADRVVVIDHGRVLEDDSLATVIARVSLRQVTLESDRLDLIENLPGVVRSRVDAAGTTFYTQDSDALVTELVRSGLPFANLAVRGATLEEAFLTLTEKELV
ncbi:ABC-2 type transport system ATP-binding protein [Conyzicola lurida]|uniref:ABC-2 type transport system ATP-binding protein n=1 Tax=Conyzicola lurida TaxID=1172621 RepID=A0A841AL84_9MICO|nr:ABC-2 type transport system ATP-binding protein [Conyzicola lurida]